MVEIIPAILPDSLEDLEEHLMRVRGITRMVQIDVVDGHFAPHTTWPYVEGETFETIVNEEEGLPLWQEFDFEIDLMVEESKKAAGDWISAGASRIIVHVESQDDRAALDYLQELREGENPIEVMLGISLSTPLEKLADLAMLANGIQVMGIARIGFQGEPFDERALERVTVLKEKYPSHIIAVDGGVTPSVAVRLMEAGAQRLVVGSALFNGDVAENFKLFEKYLS